MWTGTVDWTIEVPPLQKAALVLRLKGVSLQVVTFHVTAWPSRSQSRDLPRSLRLQYSGAMYHVMSRGKRRQNLFLNEVDRQDLLKTPAQAGQKKKRLQEIEA